jgi:hypothetical protein
LRRKAPSIHSLSDFGFIITLSLSSLLSYTSTRAPQSSAPCNLCLVQRLVQPLASAEAQLATRWVKTLHECFLIQRSAVTLID